MKMNKIRRVPEAVAKGVSMLFVLAFGLGMLYFMVDLVGTLNHLWTGNWVSVWITSWLEGVVAPLIGSSLASGVQFFEWLGFIHRKAEIITASIGLMLILFLLGLVLRVWFRWHSRLLRK